MNRSVFLCAFIFICMADFAVQASTHNPQQILERIRGSKNEGEQIVAHFCASCHAVKPLIELGAPKIKQVADWQLRIQPGLEILFKHTEEGLGAMPARGGCFECTDQQLKLAIAAMLPESLSKDYK